MYKTAKFSNGMQFSYIPGHHNRSYWKRAVKLIARKWHCTYTFTREE